MSEKTVPTYVSADGALSIFDMCPYCLSELRAGVPADGVCGHESKLIAAGHEMPARYEREHPNWREHQK